jgi:septum formation protein
MKKNVNPAIILASSSPRRIELMQNLGLRFEILPADIDEVTSAQGPAEIVTDLAYLKAKRVKELLNEKKGNLAKQPYVILAADTIVVLDGDVLNKPNDRDDAIAMLTRLSHRCHEVFTGVHLIHCQAEGTVSYQDVGVSKVYFRQLQKREIEHYVDTKEPMDKAGAYALQGIGAFLVEKIEGCPTNIIGLPISRTVALLRQCQISILGF